MSPKDSFFGTNRLLCDYHCKNTSQTWLLTSRIINIPFTFPISSLSQYLHFEAQNLRITVMLRRFPCILLRECLWACDKISKQNFQDRDVRAGTSEHAQTFFFGSGWSPEPKKKVWVLGEVPALISRSWKFCQKHYSYANETKLQGSAGAEHPSVLADSRKFSATISRLTIKA